MKITRVEPFVVHVPLRLPINDSSSHVTHWGVPHISDMMQVHQHLVAAFPNAPMLEYLPWLLDLFEEPVRVADGCIIPPTTPGASTTMRADALARWRVA